MRWRRRYIFFRSERVAKKLHLSVFKIEAFLRRERSEHGSNGEKHIYLLLDHQI